MKNKILFFTPFVITMIISLIGFFMGGNVVEWLFIGGLVLIFLLMLGWLLVDMYGD